MHWVYSEAMNNEPITCSKCERELYLDTVNTVQCGGGYRYLYRDEVDERTICPAGGTHERNN